jgi:serine/threonine-protein kinase
MAREGGFFYELRRRHVVRVAVAYAIAAWVLLQLASIVFPAFGAPEWVLKVIIALLAFGFPLALILAWAFEITPEGIRRTEPADSHDARPHEHTRRVGGLMNGIIFSVLALVVIVLLAERFLANRAPSAKIAMVSGKSIAVLPFESLSEVKENGYFASGMQDEILTRLAGIRDLKVISRTSTEQYASHPPNLKIVGEQLGVTSVLEGSVQRSGESAHINVQLIDTQSDGHLWAQSYDRELKDVFAVERDIAEKVADALKAKLLPDEAARVASVPTQDTQAYDLYLRALKFANHANDQYALTPVLMPQAIDLLQQAIARDPQFAIAFALLGRAHMYMYFFGADRTDTRLDAAKEAAKRALRLQPDLAEGHSALAYYYYWGFRDYQRAIDELDVARKTMPQNFDIEVIRAAIARRQGKWNDTLDGLRRAAIYDPRNSSPPFELGQTYAHLRRYAEADAAYAQAAELSADPALSQIRRAQNTFLWKGDLVPLRTTLSALPKDGDAYRASSAALFDLAFWSRDFATAAKVAEEDWSDVWTMSRGNSVLPRKLRLAWAYDAMGEKAKARDIYTGVHDDYRHRIDARPGDWDAHATLGLASAALGLKDEAIAEGRRAAELLPLSRDAFAGTEYLQHLAHIYAVVGEKGLAIDELKQLLAVPAGLSLSSAMLRVDPTWDSLRDDPGFQALLKDSDAPLG